MLPGSASPKRPQIINRRRRAAHHLGLTQPELAKTLVVGASSIAHFENGSRRPDATTISRYCRAAYKAGRIDLAGIFSVALPGVLDGLLIPIWKLPQSEPEQTAVDERTPPKPRTPKDRFAEMKKTITVQVRVKKHQPKMITLTYLRQRQNRKQKNWSISTGGVRQCKSRRMARPCSERRGCIAAAVDQAAKGIGFGKRIVRSGNTEFQTAVMHERRLLRTGQ